MYDLDVVGAYMYVKMARERWKLAQVVAFEGNHGPENVTNYTASDVGINSPNNKIAERNEQNNPTIQDTAYDRTITTLLEARQVRGIYCRALTTITAIVAL